jgi:hypothetical protein
LDDWGGHAHNDTLSFELAIGQTAFLIDPGSYIYTASHKWHELLRSTAYHNTIEIDGQEINRFSKWSFWGLQNDAIPKINHWDAGAAFDFLDAEHTGYMRLESPVVHRRQIFFSKRPPRYWLIRDRLTGSGRHHFVLSFHLGDVRISRWDSLIVDLESRVNPGRRLTVIPLVKRDLSVDIEDAWRSPGYGQRVRSFILRYSKAVPAPTEFLTVLLPCQSDHSSSCFKDQIKEIVRPQVEHMTQLGNSN